MSTEINWHLMALEFLVFMVTLYLLNIWLFRPLLNFMQKRDESIYQDLQEITDSANEVEQIEREIVQILDQARKEARSMIEKAQSDARALYESKMAKYRADNQNKIDEFLRDLNLQKAELKAQVLADKSSLQGALKAKIGQI